MRIIEWIRAGNKLGNVERYTLLFVEKCNKLGYEVAVMNDVENTNPEYFNCLKKAGSRQIVIGETRNDPINAFNKAGKFIKTWKPDIVHTHFINPLSIPFLRFLRTPIIYKTYHSGIEHSISLRTRIIFNIDSYLTTRCFAVSNGVRTQVIHGGGKPDHIDVIYRGIDTNYLNKNHLVLQPIPPGLNDPSRKIIISVGRFFPVKGMRYVTEAAINVLKNFKNCVWWMVGKDGPDIDYCKKLVRDAKLDENIIFLGERNDVLALLKYSYLNVMGSLVEGLPGVALEASGLGIPTVGTQVCGLNEVVIDGVTGKLVSPKSNIMLSETIMNLLVDEELRNFYSNNAINFIRKNFNSNLLIDKQLVYYRDDFEILKKV